MKTKDMPVAIGVIAVIIVVGVAYSFHSNLDKLTLSNTTLTANVTRLQTEYSNLFNSYTSLSANFTLFKLQQTTQQQQVSTTLDSNTAQVKTINTSIAAMQSNIIQAQQNIGDLGKALGGKLDVSSFNTISNNVASLQSQVAGLSSNLSSLQAQVNALQTSSPNPTYPVAQLLGDTNANAVSYLQPNYLYLTRFSSQAGALTSIALWCNTSCNVRVCIYDDMVGPLPQQLLATASASLSVASPSFNSVPIVVTTIAASAYWLGVIVDTANAVGISSDAGYTLYYANSYSSPSFPNLLRDSVSYGSISNSVLISGWSN